MQNIGTLLFGGIMNEHGIRKHAERSSYPYNPEYRLEFTEKEVKSEKEFFHRTIDRIVNDTVHFNNIFKGREEEVKDYFSKLEVPPELWSILSQFRQRDPLTVLHMYDIAPGFYIVAKEFGFSDQRLKEGTIATQLHDLGKDGLMPIDDLHRDGPLTEQEWNLMKQHPERGAKLLTKLGRRLERKYKKQIITPRMIDMLLHHHAWLHYTDYDQKNHLRTKSYPELTPRETLSDETKILTLLDSYNTMVLRRENEGFTPGYAICDLIKQSRIDGKNPSGIHYDENLVNCLIQLSRKDKSHPKITGRGETFNMRVDDERRSFARVCPN